MKVPGYLLPIFLLVLLAGSCERPVKTIPEILMKTDRDFCQLSVEKGMRYAFLYYADTNVIMPREGDFPGIGKADLRQQMAKKAEDPKLTWYPVKSEISISGDLGYTFGNWQLVLKDTVMYGNYTTIWKKQDNGSWKYVLDTGNNTPKPKK